MGDKFVQLPESISGLRVHCKPAAQAPAARSSRIYIVSLCAVTVAFFSREREREHCYSGLSSTAHVCTALMRTTRDLVAKECSRNARVQRSKVSRDDVVFFLHFLSFSFPFLLARASARLEVNAAFDCEIFKRRRAYTRIRENLIGFQVADDV